MRTAYGLTEQETLRKFMDLAPNDFGELAAIVANRQEHVRQHWAIIEHQKYGPEFLAANVPIVNEIKRFLDIHSAAKTKLEELIG